MRRAPVDSATNFSLREHNRLERRARIREAAREVFCRRGYVDATTREIAARARVANGTLFRYAADKRELLFMVINDDLDALQGGLAREPASTGRDLRKKIVQFYRPRYEYFARYPLLSRPFVNESFSFMEVSDCEVGRELRRNRARRSEVIASLTKIFEEAWSGQRQKSSASKLAAQLVHAIYLSASREWLESPSPDPKEGMKRFESLLTLAASGFDPA
jgi:AcrR family transcriptional regulator